MQLSDWWMFLSFYQNVLAVPLALVLFILLIRSRTKRRRVRYGVLILAAFLPHIQYFAGNYYFDYLCRTQAGEFIYRTVDNVEGILQMRPRDGSKDYFDRMRAGDIPEDPWGHTNWEAQVPETMFVNPPWANYRFFESLNPNGGGNLLGSRSKAVKRNVEEDARYRRYYGYDQAAGHVMFVDHVAVAKSNYGYDWHERTSLVLKAFNIHRGVIEVVNLKTQEVLGRAVGFYRVRPVQLCPTDKDDQLVYRFVSRVLRPVSIIPR